MAIGKHLQEYTKMLGDPTFDEARAALRDARDFTELAKMASDALPRNRYIREVFDSLLHSARIAVVTYLSTEVSRWGLLRKAISEPYSGQFREFIGTLHIKYF